MDVPSIDLRAKIHLDGLVNQKLRYFLNLK